MQTGGFSRKQRVLDRLVRRAAPGPHRVQGGSTALRLLEGEAHGLRVLLLLANSESNRVQHPRPGLVVVTAAQHEHGAVGASGHREADRAEQQLSDTTAATRSKDQGTGIPPLVQESTDRVFGQHLGGDLQTAVTVVGTPRRSIKNVVGQHLFRRPAEGLGERRSLIALPQRRVHQP